MELVKDPIELSINNAAEIFWNQYFEDMPNWMEPKGGPESLYFLEQTVISEMFEWKLHAPTGGWVTSSKRIYDVMKPFYKAAEAGEKARALEEQSLKR